MKIRVRYPWLMVVALCITAFTNAQDSNCNDPRYPDIERFVRAGRRGGIPNITNIKVRLDPGDNIQNAIDNGGSGVVLLNPGTYTITRPIAMRDGVVLRGSNKEDVKLSIKIGGGASAIDFGDNVENAGLEDLRVVYEFLPNPPREVRSGFQDGGFCRECFQNESPSNDGTLVRMDGDDNWVDNIDAINSGSDPIEIYGRHNTFANSLVDSCYNRGGGGEGYFDIRGDDNLIIGCTVRKIRHFAIQNGASYNVVYRNRIEGDVNYHNGDDGHNLVEQNTIIRPSWHTWGVFATGGAQFGHDVPGPENIIYNNTTFDYRENRTEFDGPNTVYSYLNNYGDPRTTNWPIPSCGTFYPVDSVVDTPDGDDPGDGSDDDNNDDDTPNAPPSVSFVDIGETLTLEVGQGLDLEVLASDTDGSVSNVVLNFNGNRVSQQNNPRYRWFADQHPILDNLQEGIYTVTAVATDNDGDTAEESFTLTVEGDAPTNQAPTVGITSPNDGQVFPEGTDLVVVANASDADGSIARLELFFNGDLVRVEGRPPYEWGLDGQNDTALADLAPGTYQLLVRAFDDEGASTDAETVTITVEAPTPNQAPIVSFTAPNNGQTFTEGDALAVAVDASDSDGTLANVALSLDGALVRTDATAPYAWDNTTDNALNDLAPGTYTLLAVATDDDGDTAETSISITVVENDTAGSDMDSDGDGVPDDQDACPNTPQGTNVDLSGCPVFSLPADNFSILATGESCRNSDNGRIAVTAAQNLDYTATLSGGGIDLTESFNTDLLFENLGAGTYSLCITVDGQEGFEACSQLVVVQPDELDVATSLRTNLLRIRLSGSQAYTIDLNGEIYRTSENEIELRLQQGQNSLKVSTDLDCQGSFAKTFFLGGNALVYPNPIADGELLNIIMQDMDDGEMTLSIYAADGARVIQKQFNNTNNLRMGMDNLPSGTYFLTIDTPEQSINHKIVKQ